MPWNETCAMGERMKFIVECERQEYSMAAVCRSFGISRKTGYKWVRRYETEGPSGLEERSRAPHNHPNAVSEQIEQLIVGARAAHPTWGPKKLKAWLERREPAQPWPAASTFGRILRRHGLSARRRRTRSVAPYTEPFIDTQQANDTWCADFKGWFRTGEGMKCHPLTISDAYSRYLIRCQALAKTTHELVKPLFEAAFIECGLPRAIRTDNGAPFATRALHGLSRLSVWWVKLGIVPERIEPGKPQQNGRHERMHRTLKQEATRPAQRTLRAQQRRFDQFRGEYNDERPHEALGGATPREHFRPSQRAYPLREPQVQYPEGTTVRRVRSNGEIKWRGRKLYLSEALVGELVGLEQVDDRYWSVLFGPVQLAWLDDHNRNLIQPGNEKTPSRKEP